MNLMRRSVLAIADNGRVERVFRGSRLARGLVNRFVAGETLDQALGAAARLHTSGMTTTLDLLGENVATVDASRAAVASYVAILQRMREAGLEPNISVKLTMLGLDLGDTLARDNVGPILEAANAVDGFVRIDMEGSDYTARTMDIFTSVHNRFPNNVGIVVQSYLRRAEDDVRHAIAQGARVRLVKGAYAEPETVAYPTRGEIDESFVALLELLLDGGHYPAIATHDPALIRATQGYALRMGIPPDRYEFQMLYGVRREEQSRLATEGYRMRVYVPFGTEWYPYFTRRIAERPANALFVLRQLFDR
ncbi:MAG: proline dehydrogenase family protein [Chloroflexia bacterium]|nr:proline dehydrogenase family protein [Chloroflexia bacterium]